MCDFVFSDDSSKKGITFPLVPVQQYLCDYIVVLLLLLGNFMGYPTRCKFAVTQNVVQNVEHNFVTNSDFHCIQQGSEELNCVVLHVRSYFTEIVLNGIPAFPERFNPPCHCAIWERCIATCFTQSLKTFLCTTTSCHINFDPGTLLYFCKRGIRALALSL